MTEKFLIIGDGVAGATAAKTIREEDEEAEIKVFTDESEPLYNRIMLKSYMKGDLPDKKFTRLHDENWYDKRDIELYLGTQIEDVDRDQKVIRTEDEDTYEYDKLLIATGGSPRKLPEDEGYDNIHYMWTMADAERIKSEAEEADRAAVIGGGLLGIDLAVAYAEHNCETYYLIRESNWWHRGLDEEGAGIIHRKLEEKGVKVMTKTEAVDFKGEEEVREIVLDSGKEINNLDSVAVAIGQEANSGFVDVEKNSSQMIKTDKFLQTSDQDIYAAGNMVEYYSPVFEKRTVNGSWDHSEAIGECAARNMLGKETEFDFVNTYGVGHFDVQFLAMGDWTGEAVSKKYSDEGYRRLFLNEDRIVGAVLIGETDRQEQIKQIIGEKEGVKPEELF